MVERAITPSTAVKASEWIRITLFCERFGVMPNPGGLFEQNPQHLKLMEKVLLAQDAAEDAKDPQRKSQARERLKKRAG